MKNKKDYFKNYYKELSNLVINFDETKIVGAAQKIKNIRKNNKLFLIGNGGSSSIANHVATDFTKISNIRSVTFNETNLITCFSNDYGFENWPSKAVEKFGIKNDICVLISSSGKSKNIINAAKICKEKKIFLITFSGFSKDNQLKKLGNINFWVNSNHYNYIEMTHHVWLVSIADYLSN